MLAKLDYNAVVLTLKELPIDGKKAASHGGSCDGLDVISFGFEKLRRHRIPFKMKAPIETTANQRRRGVFERF